MQLIKFSVVIPTADRPSLLIRAVQSVQSSSFKPAEIVIVDDGINEVSPNIYAELANRNPAIPIVKLKTKGHTGPSAARNLGVREARSEIIVFLDDDDELVFDYIDLIRKVIEKNPSIQFGFSSYTVYDADSILPGRLHSKNTESGILPRKMKMTLSGLGCGFWIKKNLFEKIGGLDEEIRTGEDIDLCVRLYAGGYQAWYEASPGVRVHRRYEGLHGIPNITASTKAGEKASYGLRIYKKNSSLFPVFSREKWFLMERYVRRSVKSGVGNKTYKELKKLLPDPVAILGIIYWCLKTFLGKRY